MSTSKNPEPGSVAPRAQSVLFGQEKAEQALLSAYLSGRLPHAWILGGPIGIGKATLAYRFARFLFTWPDPDAARAANVSTLGVDPDGAIHARIAGEAQPDLFTVKRTVDERSGRLRGEIRAEEVRAAAGFFGHTASGAGFRICVVDCADEMNHAAANALLKVLEEPPPRSLFLLVANVPGALLATIRSRCRVVSLEPLGEADFNQAIEHAFVDPDQAMKARDTGMGGLASASPGLAVRLSGGRGRAMQQRIDALMRALPDIDDVALIALAEEVGARGADDIFQLFSMVLSDAIARKSRGSARQGGASALDSSAAWATNWMEISRSIARANTLNLDRKQVVLSAFLELRQSARAGL